MVYPYQVYRHFKGHVVLILSVAMEESTLEPKVIYMHLNEKKDVWARSLSEFESLVPEGKENPTGQKHRFELVNDLKSILSQCTTENLIEELKSRPDSPFNSLDVEGLNSKVVNSDYVLGEMKNLGVDTEPYIEPMMTTDSIEEVKKFVQNNGHRCSSRTKIFKRVYVEIGYFD